MGKFWLGMLLVFALVAAGVVATVVALPWVSLACGYAALALLVVVSQYAEGG